MAGIGSSERLNKFVRRYGIWVALIVLPLLVNHLAWRTLIVPQRDNLQTLKEAQIMTQLKPKLSSLCDEAHGLSIVWGREEFSQDDPSAVTQLIRRVGERNRVQIKKLSARGRQFVGRTSQGRGGRKSSQDERANFDDSIMPIELEVLGRFGKLAQWMSAIESYSGLQIDSWQFKPGKEPSDPHQLSVQVTAFLEST